MAISLKGSVTHQALLTRCRLEPEGSSGIWGRSFMGKSVKKELRTNLHPGTGVSCTSKIQGAFLLVETTPSKPSHGFEC